MKLIVAQFKAHILQNQQTGRHADSEPCHIDRGVYLIAFEISPGSYEIIFDHL
jgi:hypothetical protein